MAGKVVSYVLRGDITQFTASMRAAAASTAKLADDLTGLDAKGAKSRKGLTTFGDTAGKMGLVAAAGLGAVVAASANFDQAMSKVQAATHETAENMDSLREAAIQAGADTAFSASEAAAGIENLAKAGVQTADILGGGLQGALDLAAAGEMEVADAAETAATALTQFGLAGEDVPHVADLLAAAAGKAQGEVSDMSMALKQSGLVADQVGLSIEETSAALGAFASAGLLGSDAGTSFKTMLMRLQPSTKEAGDAMESIGFSAYDAQGNMKSLTEIAGGLQAGLSTMTAEQRQATLQTIFGSDAIRAATVLYEQGADGVQEWINKVDDQGYAAETAAIKLDNLKGDLEALGGSLETALIGAGEGSQGMLRTMVQGITDAVNAFNDLSPAAKNASTAMLAITAVTGGGLWLGAKVVQGIANTREALDNLGISAGKTGGALKALGYTAAGLTALYAIGKGIEAIEDSMRDAIPSTEKLTQALLNLRDARVAEQFATEVGNIGAAIDRVTDAGLRAKGFDFMQGMGRQMSFLGASAEELASKVSGYESFAEAEQDIKALDAALANIVNSGSPELAAQALDNLAAAQNLSSAQVKALVGQLPQYEEALAGVDNAATLAAGATDDMTASTEAGSSALREHADALIDAVEAMKEQRSEAIRAANAQINYQASLDEARESLKENGKTLDITTEKGRANKSALLSMAAAWNDQSAAAKRAPGAHRAAISSFVDLATKMGMSEQKARDLARRILELPDKKVKVTADTSQAEGAIDNVFAKLASLDGRQARAYVTTVYNEVFNRNPIGGIQEKDGALVDYYATGGMRERHVAQIAPAGAWRVWAEPETGGEAYIPLAPEKRDRSLDIWRATGDRLGVKFAEYAEGGVNAKVARRRDRLEALMAAFMTALSGFDVTSTLGRDEVRNPTAQGIRSEIAEVREAITEAGGEWTKQMRESARRMIRQARAIDAAQRAIEQETARREELTNTLADQQQAMEQLKQAMGSFSQGVAGNFLSDVFNLSRSSGGGGGGESARGSQDLSAAEKRLIELRSSPTGDTVAAGAEASRLLEQIGAHRAEVERQAQPVERAVSGLQAMREQLIKNTADATAFAEALRSLSASGLDPALFAELAASGDLGLAQELVKGGPAAVEDINDLWNQRAAAAAEVAAFATQQVYGDQQAALQKQIDAQSKLIAAADKSIDALNREVKVLGDRVERGALRGVKSLEGELNQIKQAISSLPRETRDNKRAGKGRG